MSKIILPFFGFLFLTLGAIGIFLPIWPTTPFVLLGVACFSSTPRIKLWIMKNRFFKEHINNYEKRNGLSLKIFLTSIIWLWSMLILSIILVWKMNYTILFVLIGLFVTIHLIIMSKPRNKDKL